MYFGSILGAFAKLRKEAISFVMSDPSTMTSALTGGIFMKFDI